MLLLVVILMLVLVLVLLFLLQNGLVLLSRAPLVSPALLSTALADAAAKGISLGGDNPFLTVSQNSQICRF